MLENIEHNNNTLAIIIRANYKSKGINFFTPESFSQQLAYMSHPKGHIIDAHKHIIRKREVSLTQEVLYLKKGILRIDFYDFSESYIFSKLLYAGDVILLASEGHGFKAIEDIEMIEIKQGPFDSKEDKIKFPSINENVIKIEK